MLSSSQRNYLKDWLFYRVYNKNEEDEYSRSEFCYPEDLETSNAKESAIGESREPIDDFIKKKKVQKQIRWLPIWTLFSTNCKVTVWQMKELKPYLQRSLTISCPLKFFMNKRAGNTNKSTSQQQFPIFSPELCKMKRSIELLSRETRRIDIKTASSRPM